MLVDSVLRRVAAIVFLVTATLLATGCQRDAGEVPELQGGAPVDARDRSDEFALEGAGHGSHDGATAIELSFTRPLAAGQAFDERIAVTGADGEVVKGSWVLDDSARVLRFPYVEA